MEESSLNINPKLSEVDIAYQILKRSGSGKSFRELMQQVCAIKGITPDNPQLMAAFHTQINLDNRFTYQGQGNWGLKEWTQAKVVRRNISYAAAGRHVPFRRRSLQDEVEHDENEYGDGFEFIPSDDEEEWEE
ncbi:MAG: DNA-directed RNA polymerase subunit delta [Peptococcaceae bacterium]|jgi:DNA-directed RNA polymerase subunit delta|nr:DNA-directed RNA polymerase subunit delta [Peptococcaceae bacterium]MDH7523743.1 DNA-directed RNA polymerase subunit delta [Peptococcaceae bacterium]